MHGMLTYEARAELVLELLRSRVKHLNDEVDIELGLLLVEGVDIFGEAALFAHVMANRAHLFKVFGRVRPTGIAEVVKHDFEVLPLNASISGEQAVLVFEHKGDSVGSALELRELELELLCERVNQIPSVLDESIGFFLGLFHFEAHFKEFVTIFECLVVGGQMFNTVFIDDAQ